jgi:small subunit ribosomal protein S6
MNIECELATLRELESAFRFSDAVLRSLVIKRKQAVTTPSPLIKQEERPAATAPEAAEPEMGEDVVEDVGDIDAAEAPPADQN